MHLGMRYLAGVLGSTGETINLPAYRHQAGSTLNVTNQMKAVVSWGMFFHS